MELQGKVIAALEMRSGVSARGEWKSQDFVIETHDSFPRKMVFSVFGADRLSRFNVQVGQEVMVSFDIDAREYNGRWFNSIRAYDVRVVDPNTMGVGAQAYNNITTPPTANPNSTNSGGYAAPFPPAQPAQEGGSPFGSTDSTDGDSDSDLPF